MFSESAYEKMEKCLPSCFEIFYEATVSNAKFPIDTEDAFNILNNGMTKKLTKSYARYSP